VPVSKNGVANKSTANKAPHSMQTSGGAELNDVITIKAEDNGWSIDVDRRGELIAQR